jgi:hypothetical protein
LHVSIMLWISVNFVILCSLGGQQARVEPCTMRTSLRWTSSQLTGFGGPRT